MTTALVGCGKAKRDTACEVQDLYTSSYFGMKRALAETADEWYVISAEHGLLEPSEVVEPYDTRITDLSEGEKHNWAAQISSDVSDLPRPLVVLAGSDYTAPLKQTIGKSVFYPFDGTSGLFEQQEWMGDDSVDLSGNIEEVLP